MKNQVQLIAYADRLGGTLHGLRELLRAIALSDAAPGDPAADADDRTRQEGKRLGIEEAEGAFASEGSGIATEPAP